jgi:hypothetical protein
MSQREIDLTGREYRQVAGPKRREPILAIGWYWGVAGILTIFALRAIWYVLMGH